MSSISNKDLAVRLSKPTGEEEVPGSAETTPEKNTLSSLTNEMIQSIFSHLKPSTLANSVEPTSQHFRALTKPLYENFYGKKNPHRRLDTPPNWKQMALEKELLQDEVAEMRGEVDGDSVMDNMKPEGIIDQILGKYYVSNNAQISEVSQLSVIMLHESAEHGTPVWHEAMATLMMAQEGRHEEALVAYTAFLKTEGTLPERTWLTSKRFGWPDFLPPLPEGPSEATQRKAIMGAAAAGELTEVKRLGQAGVRLDLMEMHTTLAVVAARAGDLRLMHYLHERQVDVLEARPYLSQGMTMYLATPLWEAAKYGHVEVAGFLLELGGRPDVALGGIVSSSPFSIAMDSGNTNILKLFIEHTPQIARAQMANGNLLVAGLFGRLTGSNNDERARTIAYLIDEAHLDYEAIGPGGRRLVHLAAEAGDMALVEVLHKAGADLAVEDAAGLTPEELATDGDHTGLVTWLRTHVPAAASSSSSDKQANALEILVTQRQLRMKLMATGYYASLFDGDTVEAKVASVEAKWMAEAMEDKISKVWARHFSGRALQQWRNEVLGTDLDTIVQKLSKIAGEASKRCSERVALLPSEEQHLPMVRELMTKLFPDLTQVSSMPENVFNAAILRMPLADLQKMSEFYKGDLAGRIAAGTKAKLQDEMTLMTRFIIGGW